MNIKNFEQRVNQTILDRGYDYYIDRNIILTKQGDNEYIFQVQGSEIYEVIVRIDDTGEILFSECNCPYDFGPICKHQVAVYYKLFEMLNCDVSNNKTINYPDIKVVLDSLSKNELVNIIIDLAKKDPTLENSIIVKFSNGSYEQELENYKQLIDSIVDKYQGRDGFITYRQTSDFAYEMEDVLDSIKNTEDLLIRVDASFILLNESIEAFQYADDSYGDIGLLVTETFELIEDIMIDAIDLDIDLKEKFFNKLLEESENIVFNGWNEYRINLLRMCVYFADVDYLRNKLRTKLENLLKQDSDDYYQKYTNEEILKIIFELINKYGTSDETDNFLNKNINYSSFRELLIEKYMLDENFLKVIELTLQGEEQDEQHKGLVNKWKKLRYNAYKELSIKEEQEKLAKELLFDGEFEYYQELKELVTSDKEIFYNHLKQELKKNRHTINVYLKVILEEKDLDELIVYVRENPRSIEVYVELLQEKYHEEVIDIYKDYIELTAKSSSSRKQYRGVCRILKNYKKLFGKDKQEIMINELLVLYKRKPAFVDELSNLI